MVLGKTCLGSASLFIGLAVKVLEALTKLTLGAGCPTCFLSPGEGRRDGTGDGRDRPDPAPSLLSQWCRTVKCLVSIPWESTGQEVAEPFTPKAGTLEQFEKLNLHDSRRAKELQRR